MLTPGYRGTESTVCTTLRWCVCAYRHRESTTLCVRIRRGGVHQHREVQSTVCSTLCVCAEVQRVLCAVLSAVVWCGVGYTERVHTLHTLGVCPPLCWCGPVTSPDTLQRGSHTPPERGIWGHMGGVCACWCCRLKVSFYIPRARAGWGWTHIYGPLQTTCGGCEDPTGEVVWEQVRTRYVRVRCVCGACAVHIHTYVVRDVVCSTAPCTTTIWRYGRV